MASVGEEARVAASWSTGATVGIPVPANTGNHIITSEENCTVANSIISGLHLFSGNVLAVVTARASGHLHTYN